MLRKKFTLNEGQVEAILNTMDDRGVTDANQFIQIAGELFPDAGAPDAPDTEFPPDAKVRFWSPADGGWISKDDLNKATTVESEALVMTVHLGLPRSKSAQVIVEQIVDK